MSARLPWPGLHTNLADALGLSRIDPGGGPASGTSLGLDLASRLDRQVFEAAWRRVRTPGGAGVDGVDRARFERELDANLARVRALVLRGAWRPLPILRRRIPKPSGGERLLGIPTIADRLVQSAFIEVVGPAADSMLVPWVFGYRPGHSVDGALDHLVRRAGVRPHLEVLHADVEGLFDNLEHGFLARCSDGFSLDPLWCRMNALWRHAWATSPGRGVPQGAPLSPLLANLYLRDALDLPLERALREHGPGAPGVVACMRYGDDLGLVSDTPGGAFAALRWVEGVLARAALRLSSSKTTAALPGVAAVPLVLLGQPMALRHGAGGWRLERAGVASGLPRGVYGW